MQDDLCHSLRVRVDLLIEDALSWQQEAEDSAAQPDGSAAPGPAAAAAAAAKQHPLLSSSQPVARPYAAALPRRVAVKALVRTRTHTRSDTQTQGAHLTVCMTVLAGFVL